jgi:radical SAM superfamily enzyme YgiQ (UPF0313 family)
MKHDSRSSDEMKVCFVAPLSLYRVKHSNSVMSLTFPQLVADLAFHCEQYTIYDANQMHTSLADHLEVTRPSHVFITSITSTFSSALQCASEAKDFGCITILGGIFASMNAHTIQEAFSQFDYIVRGKPDRNLVRLTRDTQAQPMILSFPNTYDMGKRLGPTICESAFVDAYEGGTVCYEITTGCEYACRFCSMREAWKDAPVSSRPIDIVKSDLTLLSRNWTKLKIIDDDFLQGSRSLMESDLGNLFEQVILETRVDRINEKTIGLLKEFGTTHVIMGVEAFDAEFVKETKKGRSSSWEFYAKRAVELCSTNGITARPVLMLTGPHLTVDYLLSLMTKIEDWKPSNRIETLFSFFTPHPGLSTARDGTLLTNDLSKFDHLHLVHLPTSAAKGDEHKILDAYHELTRITESEQFNPPIDITREHISEFACFFE